MRNHFIKYILELVRSKTLLLIWIFDDLTVLEQTDHPNRRLTPTLQFFMIQKMASIVTSENKYDSNH
jgi:hypothetical protein